jgi:hypothetical protein
MRWMIRILIGIVVTTGLIYLYYTEVKPTVIFELRSDYAPAIPYQQYPRVSRASQSNPAAHAIPKSITIGSPASIRTRTRIRASMPWPAISRSSSKSIGNRLRMAEPL